MATVKLKLLQLRVSLHDTSLGRCGLKASEVGQGTSGTGLQGSPFIPFARVLIARKASRKTSVASFTHMFLQISLLVDAQASSWENIGAWPSVHLGPELASFVHF